jgi:hypothetical protein
MDPGTGRLFTSLEAAQIAGVANPVLLEGRIEDIERISAGVRRMNRAERRAAERKARKKA